MFFWGKHKDEGVISVFLVIILVPCIVVTSIFVDLGRVHLSKKIAVSSADLALNSLLTYYDADLKDYYGLMASCQDIGSYYDETTEFFLRNISSSKMSKDEVALLSDYWSATFSDEEILDYLITTTSETKVSGLNGYSMAEPAILRKGIVEFMKYRAPVVIGENLIDRLGTTMGANELVEQDKNVQHVENKQKYYEAEGELLKAAYRTYVAIMTYYDNADQMEPDKERLNNQKLVDYQTRINAYPAAFEEICRLVVSNLLNTGDLHDYDRVTYGLDMYASSYSKNAFINQGIVNKVTVLEEREGFSEPVEVDHYYIDWSEVQEAETTLENKIRDYENAMGAYESAVSEYMGVLPGDASSSAYAVQWWKRMDEAVFSWMSGQSKHSRIETTAKTMLEAYSKLAKIKSLIDNGEIEQNPDNSFPGDWLSGEHGVNTNLNKVKTYQDRYLTAGKTAKSDDAYRKYLEAVCKLEEISRSCRDQIIVDNLKVRVNDKEFDLNHALEEISTDLSVLDRELGKRIDELNVAIDGKNNQDNKKKKGDKNLDPERVESLDSLMALAEEYNISFNAWNNTSNEADTTMKSEDKERIEKAEEVSAVAQHIDKQSVVELKTRLINIRDQLTELKDSIETIQFASVCLKDIASVNDLKPLLGDIGEIPYRNEGLTQFCRGIYENRFTPMEDPVNLKHTTENKYNPDIDPKRNNVTDTPDLLEYFYSIWKDQYKDTSGLDQMEKDEEEASQKQKEFEEQDRKTTDYRGDGDNIVREFSGDKSFSFGTDSAISSITTLVKRIINGEYDQIRDDIYVTTYIMQMFSYATYDREGMYRLLEDEDKKKLTLTNYSNYYDQDAWKNEELEFSDNKSLTNKMISAENNCAYLAEVEYILFGGDSDQDNKKNVKKAYDTIYGIRLKLNTISAFANFWSPTHTTGQVIDAAAAGISGVTGGILPAPVIKATLLLTLAAIESSTDLVRLALGYPVELYKNASDWWISFETANPSEDRALRFGSFFSEISSLRDGKHNQDKGLFYSDYLTFFLYIGLSAGNETTKDMYRRTAEVISSNMKKHDGIVDDYSLRNSYTYFSIESDMRVKPLILTIPLIQNEIGKDGRRAISTTDWCSYHLKVIRGY